MLHASAWYSRVRIVRIPVAVGKFLLELQVFAQYATIFGTHHKTVGTHTALYLDLIRSLR